MLHARRISLHRGAQVILQDVSLTVGSGARIGVVGPNGIGKTTLLRVLAGLEQPDAGRVERAPAALTVGYLPQEPDARPGETLRQYLARRTGVGPAGEALDRLTDEMGDDPAKVDEYTAALDHFLALGGADLDARVATVLADVDLPADRLDVAMGALSGGQASRAALAAILLARFDVLLLDEPTNNLDFAGLDRLERFLVESPAAVVVVSHDRAFLDGVAHRIVELQEESHRAVEYAGGWSDFVASRELARSQQYEAHERYAAEKDRLLERQRTQRGWAEHGVKAEKKRPKDKDKVQRKFRADRTEKQAGKIKATERRIAQLEAVDKPWEGWRLELQLAPSARSGDVVARLEDAVVERGSFRLGPVDLEVAWQDRLAIVGPNGSGKSTLLGALLGTLPLAEGTRWLGPGVVVGEIDQQRGLLRTDIPLLAAFQAASGMQIASETRQLLAKFGLGPGHIDRHVTSLSPGERTRATLALLMARGVNCLVLDEPTNHLDLPAIEQIEQALESFEGTLLLVTHDRALLDNVRIDRVLLVGKGNVTEGTSPTIADPR